MKDKSIIVITTCKDEFEARYIAKELLNKKLAACVQLSEIVSLYVWSERLCDDNEIRVVIKSKKSLYEKIEKCISKMHSYETPQIIKLKSKASKKYAKWIKESTL
jgi:periplasmic divalent cation tolerance protein